MGRRRRARSRGFSLPTPPPSLPPLPLTELPAHDSSVTGLASDSFNQLLATCGLDGRLRVWGFKQQALQTDLEVGSTPTHLRLHAASMLAALVCDDRVLRLFDIQAGRLVRRFKGHRGVPGEGGAEQGPLSRGTVTS